MNYTLMNEDSLEGINVVGVETGERQDSQAQSIEAEFSRAAESELELNRFSCSGQQFSGSFFLPRS